MEDGNVAELSGRDDPLERNARAVLAGRWRRGRLRAQWCSGSAQARPDNALLDSDGVQQWPPVRPKLYRRGNPGSVV